MQYVAAFFAFFLSILINYLLQTFPVLIMPAAISAVVLIAVLFYVMYKIIV